MTIERHCRISRIRPHGGGDIRLLPSANLAVLPGLSTRLEIPAERTLLGAIVQGVAPVAVVGRLPDGSMFVATSCGSMIETAGLFAIGLTTTTDFIGKEPPIRSLKAPA